MGLGILVVTLVVFVLQLRASDEREAMMWLTMSSITAFLGALVVLNP